MRILALETTELAGSVAALENNHVLASADLDPNLRSAQSLAPALNALLHAASWQPGDVQLVAVATGPGSFTGLRVGVTTAKLFAYAVDATVLGVNTLEVIAAQSNTQTDELWAVIDAQRQQLFAAQFSRESDGRWRENGLIKLIDNAAWLAQLRPQQSITGPGLSKITDYLPDGIAVVDRQLWQPKAATVGNLACRQYQTGLRGDVFSLLPQYFRPSAAEEKSPSPAKHLATFNVGSRLKK